MKKVLIVVDMQKDFIGGSLGTEEAKAIVPNVREKIEEYRNNGDVVLFTRDTHYENYLETQEGRNLPVEHCIKGTSGWEIENTLVKENDIIVDKRTFGYDGWKEIFRKYHLDDVDSIELIGLCTDICVVSNALILKAMYPETKMIVDSNCCAGVTLESHNAALATMKMCQISVV